MHVKRLIILPYAEIDIKETVTFFKEIDEELERDFMEEINSSFLEIKEIPKIGKIED